MTDDRVLLPAFGFSGFRSFGGDELEIVGPMSKVHLLAGPNNAGKSNVLRVMHRTLSELGGGEPVQFDPLDKPMGEVRIEKGRFRCGVAVRTHRHDGQPVFGSRNAAWSMIEPWLASERFHVAGSGTLWLELVNNPAGSPSRWLPAPEQVEAVPGTAMSEGLPYTIDQITALCTGSSRGKPGGGANGFLAFLLRQFRDLRPIPQVVTIDAFRQIGPAGVDAAVAGHDGHGLIDRLAALQAPTHGRRDDRERFDAINRFLQTLFDDPEAAIEIPHDRSTINVRHQGRWLPLDSYGTGLHEVVILAAAATVLSRKLVCIEEPEIHLHPTMQRKLLRYLDEETDNQYLIATHSAQLLDAKRASITAVRMEDGARAGGHARARRTPKRRPRFPRLGPGSGQRRDMGRGSV